MNIKPARLNSRDIKDIEIGLNHLNNKYFEKKVWPFDLGDLMSDGSALTFGEVPVNHIKVIWERMIEDPYNTLSAWHEIKKNKKVDLIYSANTISHIPNLSEVFKAVSLTLSKNGIFVFEDPYIGSVVKINSYDQFYDEHVHLFSLLSMLKILSKTDLSVFDVEIIKTHGGSIRFYVCKRNSSHKKTKNLKKVELAEIKQKLHKFSTYQKFSLRVKKSKKDLLNLLSKLKAKNKKIISYGATYKSTTVFNYCNIGKKFIDYVIDTTPNKQGKFTPGKHLPIIAPEKGLDDNVDYAFLGAWNFEKEIIKKEKSFLKRGGKFIVHVPKVRII